MLDDTTDTTDWQKNAIMWYDKYNQAQAVADRVPDLEVERDTARDYADTAYPDGVAVGRNDVVTVLSAATTRAWDYGHEGGLHYLTGVIDGVTAIVRHGALDGAE